MPTFRIGLGRQMFQQAIITIDATDESTAITKAIEAAVSGEIEWSFGGVVDHTTEVLEAEEISPAAKSLTAHHADKAIQAAVDLSHVRGG